MIEFKSKHEGQKTEFLDFLAWLYLGDKMTYKTYNRVYIRDVRWTVNDFFNDPITLEDLGYTKSKMTLLWKNYGDRHVLEEGKKMLLDQEEAGKDYVSASFSFITGRKMKRLKSYCMTSAVFIKDKHTVDLNVFYRVTEATKKFGGDLVFLTDLFRQYIPDTIREEIQAVVFHFPLLYVVPIYYPLAYILGVRVNEKDKSWFAGECRRQLERAGDDNVKPKFSQTDRVYRTYKKWRNEHGKAK